jgi:hypothetical protein
MVSRQRRGVVRLAAIGVLVPGSLAVLYGARPTAPKASPSPGATKASETPRDPSRAGTVSADRSPTVNSPGHGFGIYFVSTVPSPVIDPLVFVSRQIPPSGSIYWNVPMDMPGVGPHSRFRVAAPGKLQVRNSDGTLRTLVDGAHPIVGSLNLIDVNAPDVSYDGTSIVFAGLPAGTYDMGPASNPGAWRIYQINADGSGLRAVTQSDQSLDLSQFGPAANGLQAYDDTDPAWLPDGRIVFSSTRWPSFSQYSGRNTAVCARPTCMSSTRTGRTSTGLPPSATALIGRRWIPSPAKSCMRAGGETTGSRSTI